MPLKLSDSFECCLKWENTKQKNILVQWFLTEGKFIPEVNFIFLGGKFTES